MINIGIRSSHLSQKQAEIILQLLEKIDKNISSNIKINLCSVEGDDVNKKFSNLKQMFINNIDNMIRNNIMDIAIHSTKDITVNYEDLEIISFIPRGKTNDILILNNNNIKNFNKEHIFSYKIGTSAIRRKYMLRDFFKNNQTFDIRGNISTRISNIHKNNLDGCILSLCAIQRLKIKNKLSYVFKKNEIIPQIGQGSISIISKKNNDSLKNLFSKINDPITELEVQNERYFAKLINASCSTPTACNINITNKKIYILASVNIDNKMIKYQKSVNHKILNINIKKYHGINIDKMFDVIQNNQLSINKNIKEQLNKLIQQEVINCKNYFELLGFKI